MTSGDGLARVSYLPGVVPPATGAPEPTPSPESVARPAVDLPVPGQITMDSVFGPDAVSEDAADRAFGSEEESSTAQQHRAEKISMHALTRRGQSRWELERALLGRDISNEIVEAELERLERVGLIDDAALAENLVRTQHERKGLGRSALTAELRRRHVDQQYIDGALEQVGDDDEQSRATQLAVRRAPQLHSLDTETAKRRLTGFLMRKGYAGSVVRVAVDEALSAHGGRSSGVRFR